MSTRQHTAFHKFDPDRMLHVVRGGHTEHFLPRPAQCTGELWRYEHAAADRSVCLDSGHYQFEAVVRGTFRPGYVCLGNAVQVAPAHDRPTEINGVRVTDDHVQVYPEGVEFFYHAQPGTRWTAVQARREDIQATAHTLLGRGVEVSARQVTNLTIDPHARAALAAITTTACQPAYSVLDPADLDTTDEAFFADVVLEVIAELLDLAQRDDAFDEHQIRIHQRLGLVRRAQDAMRQDIAAPYDSAALCATLGVPERTLQLAFQRTLAMSPSRWLHTARLHEARRRLCHADPLRETVAAIASCCGLGHAGRFSCNYARLFGETPSRTLRGSGPTEPRA
ncbi:MAG: helix-turn-helix domain-containing protein [Phycisphaerales bacterium JB060]